MMTEVVSTGVTISRTEAHEQLGPLPRVTGDYLLKKITLTGDSGFQSRGTLSNDGSELVSVKKQIKDTRTTWQYPKSHWN